ncbi:MAG TPA: type ISP restriction/modification enzyme [bacterium]|nr:type ISP restriction/modification enzyme [bacterium]
MNKKYRSFISVSELFPINSVGIATARDSLVIDINTDKLIGRLKAFRNEKYSDEEISDLLGISDTSTWSLHNARNTFINEKNWKDYITDILYRPFDCRKIIYHRSLIERGREEVMRHMIGGKNIGICIGRQWGSVGSPNYDVVFISNTIIDLNLYRRGGELIFPLYIYPDTETEKNHSSEGGGTMMMVFEKDAEYTDRRPNINMEYYHLLESTYGERPTPEEILYYTYAVLYAPAYRQTYAEFLKSDFPRVPFTRDYALFSESAELGEELTQLHLMKSDKLNKPIAKFHGEGSNVVHKSKKIGRNYQPDGGRVYINKEGQYFEGIPEEVWEYRVGGYQVLDKYLYDRRDRRLNNEEIQHYCRVATALYHTIELQQAIDEIYPGVEEAVVEWK